MKSESKAAVEGEVMRTETKCMQGEKRQLTYKRFDLEFLILLLLIIVIHMMSFYNIDRLLV